MSFSVTYSTIPIVVDTLPALKISHFYGTAAKKKLYTYARLYVLQKELHLSFYCFEKEQNPDTPIYFLLFNEQAQLALTIKPGSVSLKNEKTTYKLAEPVFFSSEDEQGWHWGVHVVLPQNILEENYFSLSSNSEFLGGLFQKSSHGEGFGSSFKAVNTNTMLTKENCSSFLVVPY